MSFQGAYQLYNIITVIGSSWDVLYHLQHCFINSPGNQPVFTDWQNKKEKRDHYMYHDLGMPPLLWCIFAHLLILEYPDHHQNLISSSLYYPGPLHKISSQSVHNFLSNVVHKQTNKQTDKLVFPKTLYLFYPNLWILMTITCCYLAFSLLFSTHKYILTGDFSW